ncbi:MAG: hypothetical protein SGBAC_010104 [Bacillariaceae sp.]
MAQVHYDNPFGDLLNLTDLCCPTQAMQVDTFTDDEVEEFPLPAAEETTRDDVAVFVSGQTFYIIPSLFDQVQGLPWYQQGGLFHLDAEADLFEVILQYYLTGALPPKALLKKRRESLSRLVAPLSNATELQHCVQGGKKKKTKSPSSSLPSKRKSFFSFKSSKKTSNMQGKPFDDLDDSQSILSGALSQVTQATQATTITTMTSMSERENPKKRQKGMNGWKIMNRSAAKQQAMDSLRAEYIV